MSGRTQREQKRAVASNKALRMRQPSSDGSSSVANSSTAYQQVGGSSGSKSARNSRGGEAADTFSNLWLEPWPNVRFIFLFLAIMTLLDVLLFTLASYTIASVSNTLSKEKLKDLSALTGPDILRFDTPSQGNGTIADVGPFLHGIQMKEVVRNPFGWDTAAADGAWHLTQAVELATALLSCVLAIGLLLLLLPCRRSRDAHQRRDQALVLRFSAIVVLVALCRGIGEYQMASEGDQRHAVIPQVQLGISQGSSFGNPAIGYQYMGFFASRTMYYVVLVALLWSVTPRASSTEADQQPSVTNVLLASVVVFIVQILAVLASALQLFLVSEAERLLGLADEAQLGLLPSATCAAFAFSELRHNLVDAGLLTTSGMLGPGLPQGIAPDVSTASWLENPLVVPSSAALRVHPSVLAWPTPGSQSSDAIAPIVNGLVYAARNRTMPAGWDYWDEEEGLHVSAHVGLFDSAELWFDFELLIWIVGIAELLGYVSIGICVFWVVWVLDPMQGLDQSGPGGSESEQPGSCCRSCGRFLEYMFCCSASCNARSVASCCGLRRSVHARKSKKPSTRVQARNDSCSCSMFSCLSCYGEEDVVVSADGGWPQYFTQKSLNGLSRQTDQAYGSDYVFERDQHQHDAGRIRRGLSGEGLPNPVHTSRREQSGDVNDADSVARSFLGASRLMQHQGSSGGGQINSGSNTVPLPSAANQQSRRKGQALSLAQSPDADALLVSARTLESNSASLLQWSRWLVLVLVAIDAFQRGPYGSTSQRCTDMNMQMTTSGTAGAWLHQFGSIHLTMSAPSWLISNDTSSDSGNVVIDAATGRAFLSANVSLADVSIASPFEDVMCALRWGTAWHPGVPCSELPFVDRLGGGRPDQLLGPNSSVTAVLAPMRAVWNSTAPPRIHEEVHTLFVRQIVLAISYAMISVFMDTLPILVFARWIMLVIDLRKAAREAAQIHLGLQSRLKFCSHEARNSLMGLTAGAEESNEVLEKFKSWLFDIVKRRRLSRLDSIQAVSHADPPKQLLLAGARRYPVVRNENADVTEAEQDLTQQGSTNEVASESREGPGIAAVSDRTASPKGRRRVVKRRKKGADASADRSGEIPSSAAAVDAKASEQTGITDGSNNTKAGRRRVVKRKKKGQPGISQSNVEAANGDEDQGGAASSSAAVADTDTHVTQPSMTPLDSEAQERQAKPRGEPVGSSTMNAAKSVVDPPQLPPESLLDSMHVLDQGAQQISQSAQAIEAIVSDVLSLQRLDDGKLVVEPQVCDIDELLVRNVRGAQSVVRNQMPRPINWTVANMLCSPSSSMVGKLPVLIGGSPVPSESSAADRMGAKLNLELWKAASRTAGLLISLHEVVTRNMTESSGALPARRSSRASSRDAHARGSMESSGNGMHSRNQVFANEETAATSEHPSAGGQGGSVASVTDRGLLATHASGPRQPQPSDHQFALRARQFRSGSIDRYGVEHGPWRRSSAPQEGTVHLEAFADGPKLGQAYFNILLFGVRRMVTYPNSGEISDQVYAFPSSSDDDQLPYANGDSQMVAVHARVQGRGGTSSAIHSHSSSIDTKLEASGTKAGPERTESADSSAELHQSAAANAPVLPSDPQMDNGDSAVLERFGMDAATGMLKLDGPSADEQQAQEAGSAMKPAQVVAGLSPIPPPLWDLDQVRANGQLAPELVDELEQLLKKARYSALEASNERASTSASTAAGRGASSVHPAPSETLGARDISNNKTWSEQLRGLPRGENEGSEVLLDGPSSLTSGAVAGSEVESSTPGSHEEIRKDIVSRIHSAGKAMTQSLAGMLSPKTQRFCAPMCLSWIRSAATSMYIDMLEPQRNDDEDAEPESDASRSGAHSKTDETQQAQQQQQKQSSGGARSGMQSQRSRGHGQGHGKSFNSMHQANSGSLAGTQNPSSSASRGIVESMLMSSKVRWVAPRFVSGWVWVRGESPRFSHNDALMLSRQLLSSNLMLHEGGASLGLVISDATVELHRGLIGYASAEGIGSILFFWVRLPQVLGLSNGQAVGTDGKTVQRVGDHPNPVIMVVDDERSILKVMQKKVQKASREGVRLLTESSAEAALATMRRECGDSRNQPGLANWLVFMDHGLGSGMSGADASRVILQDKALGSCLIVGHTGGGGSEDEFRAAGVNMIMSKPARNEDLNNLMLRQNLRDSS